MPSGKQFWIFDMDGTLTHAVHDFARIRSELGLPEDSAILEAIHTAEAGEKERMLLRLHEIEMDLADQAQPAAGIHEFLTLLAEQGQEMAILTRNQIDIAIRTLAKAGLADFFRPSTIVDREMAPPKPDPAGIQMHLDRTGFSADQTLMVGDYLYDLKAGRAAGCRTIYMDPHEEFPFRQWADFCARDFVQLMDELSI